MRLTREPARECMMRRNYINPAPNLDADYIWANPELHDVFDFYETENVLVFRGGWIEVRKYRWSRQVNGFWGTNDKCYILDMAIDGDRPNSTVSCMNDNSPAHWHSIGKAFIVPPGRTIQYKANIGFCHSIRCALDADVFEQFMPNSPLMWENKDFLDETLNLSGSEIRWLLYRMYREARSPDLVSASLVELLAKQVALEITRRFRQFCRDEKRSTGGLAPWRLQRIHERVQADAPRASLGELAGLCGMTVRHLSRAFRSETGQTIGKFIEAAMMERAITMLSNGEKVREVADSLGYSSSSSFSSAFRRTTGMSPGDMKCQRIIA